MFIKLLNRIGFVAWFMNQAKDVIVRNAINDDVILKCIIHDMKALNEELGNQITNKDVEQLAKDSAEKIVSAMWDEYSHVLSDRFNNA